MIVSTGADSTGWIQSVYAGASGIVQALGGQVVPPPKHGRMAWDSNYLVYAVREPFPSKHSNTNMVYGVITPDTPLHISSQMTGNGVIFSDGVESDYLSFNTGASATIRVADKKTTLIMK